jgi:dihydrofolate synthase/folylpolyglutamate synthase
LYTVADAGLSDGVRNIRVKSEDRDVQSFSLDLTGGYQLHNVATVLATVQALQSILPVSTESIQTGLQAVVPLTGLKGRFQILHQQPWVIVDTAHNKPGLDALFTTIESIPFATLRLVIGLVADKDRTGVLLSLPESAIYYFCQADSPRSLPAATLQAEAASLGRMGTSFLDVNSALAAALQQATPDDLILVTGSNYHIAELIEL